MAKAIHSMVRVLDEARSVDFYQTAFDLEVADRFDFDSFTLVYLRNAEADFELELTVNKGTAEAYDLGRALGTLTRNLTPCGISTKAQISGLWPVCGVGPHGRVRPSAAPLPLSGA